MVAGGTYSHIVEQHPVVAPRRLHVLFHHVKRGQIVALIAETDVARLGEHYRPRGNEIPERLPGMSL